MKKVKNNSKNICLVIDTLVGGGAERVVLVLATTLAHLGHQVHIISLENKIGFDIKNAKFKVHFAEQKKHPIRFIRHFRIAQMSKNLKNKITEIGIDFDFVIANLGKSEVVCKTAKLPNLYFCIHGSISMEISSKYENTNKYIKRFVRKIRREFLIKKTRKNQNLICVSKGVQNDLLDLGIKPKTVQTIYNPFDFVDIQNQAEKYQVDERDYIIHIGRFDKIKRHDILIEAYKKSGIKQKLLLFGDDNNPIGKEIRQLVADLDLSEKVILKGFNPNPFPYIKNAKCLVLSSDSEGLGMVLVEALILATPIVSTDCLSGPSEILIQELQPFLSPVGDIDTLAKNIKKMAENPIKITPDYYQRFSADECAKKYLALCGK